ncbi:S-methyl-5'-thioadenosine phosphorylase, partial [Plecturocebus cupreus]
MFLASNICRVGSGTIRVQYCWLSWLVSRAKPDMKCRGPVPWDGGTPLLHLSPYPLHNIGIIGGTGLDDPEILEGRTEKYVDTPFGKPSDALILGKIKNVDCILLARHGRQHTIMPSKVNYQANIWALKEEGCTHVIVTTACGSLREEIQPGDIVIIDQFIDRLKCSGMISAHCNLHLLGSNNSSVSASRVAGNIGTRHKAQRIFVFLVETMVSPYWSGWSLTPDLRRSTHFGLPKCKVLGLQPSFVIQARVQWCNLCSLQPYLSGLSNCASASCVAGITGMYHHAWLIFVFLVETGYHHVGEAGLALWDSNNPLTLASQSAGIT